MPPKGQAPFVGFGELPIAGIPADILATLERAQAEFEAEGGRPSCGSTVLGVHEAHCKTGKDDLF